VRLRTIYLHFATRTELVLALYRSFGESEDLAESRAREWERADAVARLDGWARHIVRAHPRILDNTRAIERTSRTDEHAAVLWHTTMRNWHATCQRLATWLPEDGMLAAPWTVPTAADHAVTPDVA
jgi:hypothetical protein